MPFWSTPLKWKLKNKKNTFNQNNSEDDRAHDSHIQININYFSWYKHFVAIYR